MLHPWELHGGVDTKHYPDYALLTKRLQGPNLFMPTEFLHGLFDGGAGAGLDDYWSAMMASPFGAGGVIWALIDEGIMRTDQSNKVDVFGTYAPDGIVGPHHEKKGSYYAVRHLWSPVQIDTPVLDAQFNGKLTVHNHYDFTSLAALRVGWKLVRFAGPSDIATDSRVLASGTAAPVAIGARSSGLLDLKLPHDWRSQRADAIEVTAFGPDQQSLWTWTFATPPVASAAVAGTSTVTRQDGRIVLAAGAVRATIDAASGMLVSLQDGDRMAALGNGPRLTFARPSTGATEWLALDGEASGVRRLARAQQASVIEIDAAFDKSVAYARFKIELSADGSNWHTIFDGARRAVDGITYPFPPQQVSAVRISALADANGKPVSLKRVRIGDEAGRFPVAAGVATITQGTDKSGSWVEAAQATGLDRLRWTMAGDGTLKLDYSYRLDGTYQYHGVTFDLPERTIKGMRWLGEGPYRVWQKPPAWHLARRARYRIRCAAAGAGLALSGVSGHVRGGALGAHRYVGWRFDGRQREPERLPARRDADGVAHAHHGGIPRG